MTALIFIGGFFLILPFIFTFLLLILEGMDDIVTGKPSEKSKLVVSFLLFVIGFLLLLNGSRI